MRRIATVLVTLSMLLGAAAHAAPSRIKDLVDVEGVRRNQLVGYGLVVGLNDTGDKLKDGGFTKQSLQSMLNRLGVKPTDKGTTSKNVAAVMVTADVAAVRPPGQPDRRLRLGARRRRQPARRHLAGDAAAGRRRRGLRGGARAGRRRRLLRQGPGRKHRQGRADLRPDRQRRHRRARGGVRDGAHGFGHADLAQPRLHHRAAHRPGGQRLPARAGGEASRSQHRAHRPAGVIRGQRRHRRGAQHDRPRAGGAARRCGACCRTRAGAPARRWAQAAGRHRTRACLPTSKELVEPTTRGDPKAPLLWTAKSLRNLAAGLARAGPSRRPQRGRPSCCATGLQPAGQPQDPRGDQPSRPRRPVRAHQRPGEAGAGGRRAGDLGRHQEEGAGRRLQEWRP